MPNIRVIGIGDNVIDKYVEEGIMYPGGNALNFCAYAGLKKLDTAYIGKFGNDCISRCIKSALFDLNIDISFSRFLTGESGYTKVKLKNNDRVFMDSNKGGISKETPWDFTDDDLKYISKYSIIHTSVNSYIENDLVLLKKTNVPISFDFSCRWNNKYLKKVCPNIDIAFFSCSHLNKSEIIEELKKAQHYGSAIAIGTVGESGSYALVDNKILYHPAFINGDTLDTMGAGDAYITAFLIGLFEQLAKNQDTLFDVNLNKLALYIKHSMKEGACFSSKVCKIKGAFGYGKYIRGC